MKKKLSGVMPALVTPFDAKGEIDFKAFGKLLEMLKGFAPKLTRVAVLVNPANPSASAELQDVQQAVAALGLPAPEERVGYAAHDFSMLMGAPRVYLTRAQKVDGVPLSEHWLIPQARRPKLYTPHPTMSLEEIRVGTQRALVLIGKNPQAFAAEQWLRADADPRPAGDAAGGSCDEHACIGRAIDGRYISVVQTREAFVEDCARVAMIITPLHAPSGCAAPLVIDRDRLAETGAVTLRFQETAILWTTARESGEDRPWSRPPAPRRKPVPAPTPIPEREEASDDNEPP